MYSPIPLVHELAQVYLILHHAIRDFPKLEKFSLGVTMEKVLLDTIQNCFLATTYPKREEKAHIIGTASATFDTLKLYIRLSISLKCLSDETYVKLIPGLGKIGNMLGGWLKDAQKSYSNSKTQS